MPEQSTAEAALSRRSFLLRGALAAGGAASLAGGAASGCIGIARRWLADFDLVFRRARIVDGSGGPSYEADLAVKGDRIAAIGDLASKRGAVEFAARDLALAPGWIDLHTHSDVSLLADGRGLSKLYQGVTTEVTGQDGRALAPLTEERRRALDDWMRRSYDLPVDWTDFRGLFRAYARRGHAPNIVAMNGASALRTYAAGADAARPVTPQELQKMIALLRASMAQGACGISAGLEYIPGAYATEGELAALAQTAGLYAVHLRSESAGVERALAEALRIGRRSGARVHISHLKAQGRPNWSRLPTMLAMLEAERRAGGRVSADRYPYTAYNTRLTSLLPVWARVGGAAGLQARMSDPAVRARMAAGFEHKIRTGLGSYDSVMLSELPDPYWRAFEGRRLGQLARELGRAPFELCVEILLKTDGSAAMVGFAMDEGNLRRLLRDEHTAVASDGAALDLDFAVGRPHPRSFGSFPRVLGRYVRELGTLSLEAAVRRMSALPADILGLKDRGRIQTGMAADLTLFDPQSVADRAEYLDPRQAPEGIAAVIVNGEPVVHEGEFQGKRPGRILKPGFQQ